MASVALEPASRLPLAELAAIFTAGYEDYFTPLAVDEAAFRFMVETWDIDLEVSRVALLDGEPVGICTVAVRGDRGWISGLGVGVSHRKQGIGVVLMRRVLEETRLRGLREIWLEVLVQNEPAVRLYERLGFGHVRELEVWALDELEAERHELPSLAVADALGREERPPWQRADESVAHLEGVEALGDERGSLVYRAAGGVASLLQCDARDADAAHALVAALPAEAASARWLNGPTGHPLNEALASLGGALAHRQHEMRLRL
jgi:ribosomal protein S18 acetylase RimI-like enzyme